MHVYHPTVVALEGSGRLLSKDMATVDEYLQTWKAQHYKNGVRNFPPQQDGS